MAEHIDECCICLEQTNKKTKILNYFADINSIFNALNHGRLMMSI